MGGGTRRGRPKRSPISAPEAAVLDDPDRRIVAALQISPRASWQQIATGLGVSESTVSRRAKRLLRDGSVHVAAIPDPLRCGIGFPVLVQAECSVGAAEDVARTLALRSDVRFLALLTGTYDLVFEVIVPSRDELGEVVIRQFSQVSGITRTTTETVIHNFKMSYDWSRSLLGEQAAALDHGPRARMSSGGPVGVDAIDLQLLQLLGTDGRLSAAELAQQSDVSESSARRRVEELASSGAIHFGTLVDPRLMGFDSPVFMWLDVDLASIEVVAERLSAHPEVRYLSATAGYSDLIVEVILPDLDRLYGFMTEVVGSLPGVRRSRVGLEIDTVKRGYLTEEVLSTGRT